MPSKGLTQRKLCTVDSYPEVYMLPLSYPKFGLRNT